MPQIETIPVPLYEPTQAYHHLVDNTPIIGLIERIDVVNSQVDLNTANLLQSIGTQGTLANRLAQSINPDGSIKAVAIDNALHSIAEHLDGGGYVRMTTDERAKLSFIAPNATALVVNFDTISGTIAFDSTLEIDASDSITWRYEDGKIFADTNFPSSVRHAHYYNVVPHTVDRKNYTTTSLATAYREGSLRVYVNGVRLNDSGSTYVPIGLPGSITWTALYYTEGAATSGVVTAGSFMLSSTLAAAASVVIDFDVLYS